MTLTATLGIADYIVFSLVLVGSMAIGVYYGCVGRLGGKKATAEDMLKGGGDMGVLPVAMSLVASFASAITMLGTPAEVFIYGTMYWDIALGYIVCTAISAHLYVPVFYNLKITSVFEYLEMRFGRTMRMCCTIAFITQMMLYTAIVEYAPSLALAAVTGLNVWVSVFALASVGTIYTTLGGIKGVIWSNVFQLIMMFAGVISVIVVGAINQGGFGNIWQQNYEGGRIEFLNFDANPFTRHTVWNMLFGGTTTWVAIYGVNQAQVQRCLTVKTLKTAQGALWVNLVGLCILLSLCCMAGMTVYAEYRFCDPIYDGRIFAMDQLMPLYVMERLGHLQGLPGLFIAALFSAALSTISSGLNALAAVTLQDIIIGRCYPNLAPERAGMVTQVLVLVYGVICCCLTFLAAQLGGILTAALAVFGMLGGPVLVVFTLGMFYPMCNEKGAVAAFFSSLTVVAWIAIGAQIYKPINTRIPSRDSSGCNSTNVTGALTSMITGGVELTDLTTALPEIEDNCVGACIYLYKLSYIHYATLALIIGTIVGVIVSYATGKQKAEELDPRLMCPIFDKMFPFLPESIRFPLRFGVDYSKTVESTLDEKQELRIMDKSDNGKKGQLLVDDERGAGDA